MKHKNSKCLGCGKDTKSKKAIAVSNLKNVLVCKRCNTDLINYGQLNYGQLLLKVVGKRGDFLVVVAVDRERRGNF